MHCEIKRKQFSSLAQKITSSIRCIFGRCGMRDTSLTNVNKEIESIREKLMSAGMNCECDLFLVIEKKEEEITVADPGNTEIAFVH